MPVRKCSLELGPTYAAALDVYVFGRFVCWRLLVERGRLYGGPEVRNSAPKFLCAYKVAKSFTPRFVFQYGISPQITPHDLHTPKDESRTPSGRKQNDQESDPSKLSQVGPNRENKLAMRY
jgi:hypothetical protein